MNPMLGEIKIFAGSFAPRGWAFCDGQLLSIEQNSALFSILGTIYGGDGRTTFGLPDLRGRAPIHEGAGPGLSNHRLGSKGGAENITLTAAQMPTHTHVSRPIGTTANPNGRSPLNAQVSTFTQTDVYNTGGPHDADMAPNDTSSAGGGQSHSNMQPYLAINYIIAVEGTYPSRT